ncbi:hypothetical protein DY052_06365 [Apilactobacillus timberlakei]|uniref:hypothetical protein n=1 Tax=Apilactobacillus timberlakei TaxID=2008380 RepID=UPI00112BF8CF|nr:hypothetical protein [Apilactobacillus timberlakei]TPR15048.1 hypothetical protein DY052_06365 [Apilactobacillus timberlakei]
MKNYNNQILDKHIYQDQAIQTKDLPIFWRMEKISKHYRVAAKFKAQSIANKRNLSDQQKNYILDSFLNNDKEYQGILQNIRLLELFANHINYYIKGFNCYIKDYLRLDMNFCFFLSKKELIKNNIKTLKEVITVNPDTQDQIYYSEDSDVILQELDSPFIKVNLLGNYINKAADINLIIN